MRLREVVQPLISKARGTQCENCLSRRQLQVTCVIPLEVLAAQFDAGSCCFDDQGPSDELFAAITKVRAHALTKRTQGLPPLPR